jgi:hypothetical protein
MDLRLHGRNDGVSRSVELGSEGLLRLACEHDLEGIVAKQKFASYLPEQQTTWMKIRNRSYSQWVGCQELFERERSGHPHAGDWDLCTIACVEAVSNDYEDQR